MAVTREEQSKRLQHEGRKIDEADLWKRLAARIDDPDIDDAHTFMGRQHLEIGLLKSRVKEVEGWDRKHSDVIREQQKELGLLKLELAREKEARYAAERIIAERDYGQYEEEEDCGC